MATSGVYDFALTARSLVTKAMRELKIIAVDEEPTAGELEDGIQSLNGMFKSWQVDDSVWREDTTTVSVAAGSATLTLDPEIRAVTDARLAVSATYQRPMQQWTRADYNQIPNKLTVGEPLTYYVSRQRSDSILYVWPVPASAVNIILDYQRGIEAVTDANQTLDIPEDWQEAVWTGLAVRMAGSYGSAAELTPELVQRASSLKQMLLDEDRPESYFLGPWDDRYYG